ncbi:MAG: ClpXP protease specificity-enhancing factor [Methylococcales bacterium]|nr:ClpXP protease specificity-enhancing factor [Methylococcales bacterium]
MTSLKPYLIRSIYEWILDNQLTPYLLVDAENDSAILPMQFVDDGKIVLNIRPEAVEALSLGNDTIEFNARFSGKPMHIIAPVVAVMAIYAKENGKGMVFNPEDEDTDNTPPPEKTPPAKPALRVVK